MDKETRSAIERATQKARRILETDFAEQLEGTFEVLLSGVVAPRGGAHLSPRQQAVRERIVASVEHRRAAGERPAEAVASYLRDAAFTALNRFAALEMIEARGLAQECVRKGEQSSGYREFIGLAPGVALLPGGDGYRLYLECLFDELSTEVKVLFDRCDPASALWPRRAAFEELLGVLNAPELAAVWGEDETIGWVYQYFNSGDERRAMRDASQAPRNSRELAVRNQFFTPRYVVRFLTENTLARIWIEMMGDGAGASRIADRCDFLVRDAESRGPRAKKDPRDLKLLDPACGSGHFLLYSFDLFLSIYEEAWADPTAAASTTTGRTLRDDYPDLAILRRAAPALILEQNLHGVDIDPRCAQIAALALWLRAQRAWKDAGLPASQRPRITKTNIVVAEPMPGDTRLVEEFAATLNPPLLGTLFRKMVAEMRLAGELGTLLKVETLLTDEIRKASAEYNRQKKATGFLPGFEPLPTQGELDFSQIDDDAFFDRVEDLLLAALRGFAESAEGGAEARKRLFAGDAAQGIALIDMVRSRYDVVLMNPPFGQPTTQSREALIRETSSGRDDIGAAFISRGVGLLQAAGVLGVLSNRTFLAIQTLEDWRRQFLLGDGCLSALADLGFGVLDGAMVEAAAYVITCSPRLGAVFFDLLQTQEKERSLLANVKSGGAWLELQSFKGFSCTVIAHWLPPSLLTRVAGMPVLGESVGASKAGFDTGDNFRFLRLFWEVDVEQPPSQPVWTLCSKGGEYAPFFEEPYLAVKWSATSDELTAISGARVFNTEYCFRAGVVYPMRTTSDLSPRPLPRNCAFTKGAQFLDLSGKNAGAFIALAYTRPFKVMVEAAFGGGDVSVAGSAARNYTVGVLESIPVPEMSFDEVKALNECFEVAARERRARRHLDETSVCFDLGSFMLAHRTLAEWIDAVEEDAGRSILTVGSAAERADKLACSLYGLSEEEVGRLWGPHPFSYRAATLSKEDRARVHDLVRGGIGDESVTDELVSEGSFRGSRRVLTKKAFFADRRLELVAHLLERHPQDLMPVLVSAEPLKSRRRRALASDLASVLAGVALGRWDPREWSSDKDADLFSPVRPATGRTSSGGLLDTDPGSPYFFGAALDRALAAMGGDAAKLWLDLGRMMGHPEIERYFRDAFFDEHITRYSKSRRKAPIYWQLATPSASYSVWLYAHRLTPDTFFQVLQEVVVPKLALEERKLLSVTQEFGPTPTSSQRKEIAAKEAYVAELRAFRDEIALVAPLWRANLDDGVVLAMAPLWRLVPQHRAWQKELKAAWDSLSAGEYDWAHVAMHLWPERVVPKCATDRSLAIAHGLEEVFWEEDTKGKWVARKTPLTPVAHLVAERTSPAVKAALKELLEAPVPGGGARATGRGKRRNG